MKVLVNVFCDDYASAGVNETGILVPDDFNMVEAIEEWRREAFIPLTGRNQHGEWKSKKRMVRTIDFMDWLRKKYETVTVEDSDVW